MFPSISFPSKNKPEYDFNHQTSSRNVVCGMQRNAMKIHRSTHGIGALTAFQQRQIGQYASFTPRRRSYIRYLLLFRCCSNYHCCLRPVYLFACRSLLELQPTDFIQLPPLAILGTLVSVEAAVQVPEFDIRIVTCSETQAQGIQSG